MPEELFRQGGQVAPIANPSASNQTPIAAPSPSPAPAPVQVPPTTNLAEDLLPKTSASSKLLLVIGIIILAVVVIGGAGIVGYLLSRMQQTIVTEGTGSVVPGEENPALPGDETETTGQAEPGAGQGVAPAATDAGVVPGEAIQTSTGGASGSGTGETAQPADGAGSQPVINVPQQPAIQAPAAPAVQIPPAEQVINPPLQNLISAGTITAALDLSSPKTQVAAGKTTVTTAEFKLSAQNETFKITDITLALNDETAVKSIAAVFVKYDGQIVYKEVLGAGNVSKNYINIKNLNLALAPNAAKILTVSYQLGDVKSETMSGKNVQTALYSLKGVDTKNKALAYSKIIKGNSIYVYKSYPTISSAALSSGALAKGINTFAKFTMANNGGSKIAWRRIDVVFKCKFDQLVCGLNYGNPVVKDGGIYNLEVMGPGVAAGEESQNLLIKNVSIYRLETINGVTSQLAVPGGWHFRHETGGIVTASFIANADQEVSGTKTYAVKGDVLMNVVVGDYVSTKYDATSKVMVSSAGSGQIGLNAYASLTWTDYSALNHSDETGDWHNDFLIKYLPLATQTIKK